MFHLNGIGYSIMALAFIHRAPTTDETKALSLMFATFRDGSGNQKDSDGKTRADWRQIERCFAELLNGYGGEDKNIFDVIAPDPENPSAAYGFSIKSKQLAPREFETLSSDGRVYMEIANSPAKFWSAIKAKHGFTENDFRSQRHPDLIGNTILQTVMAWHVDGKTMHDRANNSNGTSLDLANSCYLCVSSSNESAELRRYQIHVFPLHYPSNIVWRYKSAACLSGYDPASPNKALIDWYGLSGGQFKYYPSVTAARFSSAIFTVPNCPRSLTISEKAKLYFPDAYPIF